MKSIENMYKTGAVGIMQSPKLFAKVVPSDQSMTENYAGKCLIL